MSSEIGCNRIADKTLASAETEMAVEGLDLDADGAIQMIITLVNPTEEVVFYDIYFNGDREASHYWHGYTVVKDGELTAGSVEGSRFAPLEPGESALTTATLVRGPDGIVRWDAAISRGAPPDVVMLTSGMVWTVPENVTKVEVVAGVEGGIGAGSQLILMNTGSMG
ncbi:MAG: hypothetical protein CEE41_04290 [Hadesarchaea archaeon B3_Hades]|nr:MAG: hypothetical protein CEE41_04290 [Hadesarchaea archaeon B3_Hades]